MITQQDKQTQRLDNLKIYAAHAANNGTKFRDFSRKHNLARVPDEYKHQLDELKTIFTNASKRNQILTQYPEPPSPTKQTQQGPNIPRLPRKGWQRLKQGEYSLWCYPIRYAQLTGNNRYADTNIRYLGPRAEKLLQSRRDGIWGLEKRLRWMIRTYPGRPHEWPTLFALWMAQSPDLDLIWHMAQPLLLDWFSDTTVTPKLKPYIKLMIDEIPTILNQFKYLKPENKLRALETVKFGSAPNHPV